MKPFNPHEWLPQKDLQGQPKIEKTEKKETGAAADAAAVERALQALEASGIDLTSTYDSWRDLGFSFAAGFNEQGRSYFHRVSRFHPEYDAAECDKQYDRCLKSGGSGIGLGTFFHHLKQAGIKLPTASDSWNELTGAEDKYESSVQDSFEPNPETIETEVLPEKLPSFPEELYEQLPDFLQKVVVHAASPEEKDILLLGALTCISACLSNIFGVYDGAQVYPNLYLFVSAPPSAGKGKLSLCKNLVLPIHRARREETARMLQDYEQQLAEYNAGKGENGEKPVKPPEKMLFIPANNSTTGVFQLLHDNQCHGLIFETEGDTLTNAFKNDYGNYSDGFRKAYHHETISYYRRTEREYVSLDEPALSTVLTGTPRQVTALIPSAENGLFSRFLFYYLDLIPVWKDVFAESTSEGLHKYFLELGYDFRRFHDELPEMQPMKVVLSSSQQEEFNAYFSSLQHKYLQLQPRDYVATVRRMGLNCFRLAMIFTALRFKEDDRYSTVRVCKEEDFRSALTMTKVLIRHSSYMFYCLAQEKVPPMRSNRKERFLDALPAESTYKDLLAIGAGFGIPERSIQRYIADFTKANLLLRESRSVYVRVSSL